MIAMSRAAGLNITLDDFQRISNRVSRWTQHQHSMAQHSTADKEHTAQHSMVQLTDSTRSTDSMQATPM